MKLSELAEGERSRIVMINAPSAQRARLSELGMVVGTECMMIGATAAGDPLLLRVRGGTLALRKCAAEKIGVTRVASL